MCRTAGERVESMSIGESRRRCEVWSVCRSKKKYQSARIFEPGSALYTLRPHYIDFRKIQSLSKGFLTDGKLDVCFSDQAIKAVLYRYGKYLSIWTVKENL